MKKILLALLCVSLFAGAAFANGQQDAGSGMTEEQKKANLEASLAIDISDVRGSDGQLLLIYGETRPVPPKPADREMLDM